MFPFIDYSDPTVPAFTTGLSIAQKYLDADRALHAAAHRGCATMADDGCPLDIPAGQEEHHAWVGGPLFELLNRQVLLSQRTTNALRHPAFLANPGGRLVAGESVEEGLARVLNRFGVRLSECIPCLLRCYTARNLPGSYRIEEPVMRLVIATLIVNHDLPMTAHLRSGLVRVPPQNALDMPLTLLSAEDLRLSLPALNLRSRRAS